MTLVNKNSNSKTTNPKNTKQFILTNVLKLPQDMINVIKEYIPCKYLIFTNKTNYSLYHSLLRENIVGNQFESYVRDMIRRDNFIAFSEIIKENIDIWNRIHHYEYKHCTYNNYIYFLLDYCIENESNQCRILIKEYFKEYLKPNLS